MKLLDRSLKYLSIFFLLILSIWAVVFYVSMLEEVYDSIDDGLDNYKLLILQKAQTDTTIFSKHSFEESNYAIREISFEQAFLVHDTYQDTLMYMPFEDDLEPVRMLTTAFESDGKFYLLKIVSSMVEEDDLIRALLWATVLLYACLLLSIILINNLVLRKVWQPFYKILKYLRTFDLHENKGFPDIKTDIREFSDLKETTAKLLEHTTEIFHQQKQFTENAAHELQTPIAIAISKLELVLDNEHIPEDELKNIADVLRMLERLTKLNRSLLLLTKIENNQFINREMLSVNELVRQSVEEYSEQAAFRSVGISFTENDKPEIMMDKTLAQVFINNLIRNAIFHNVPGGEVHIFISAGSLKICNTGKTGALDSGRIFNRFYKNSVESTSTGLGLAIVKAIAHIYKFGIEYKYDTMHCFEIFFKKN